MVSNFGDHGKRIVEANTPEAIDSLQAKTVRVVVQEGDDFHNVEINLISVEIRAMVDTICCVSVYGHLTMFEKISLTRRSILSRLQGIIKTSSTRPGRATVQRIWLRLLCAPQAKTLKSNACSVC